MKVIHFLINVGVGSVCLLTTALATPVQPANATAIFSGGSFLYLQRDLDKVPGVTKTTVGYIGGTIDNPTYQQVQAGNTGYHQAVQVEYNPVQISYSKLLDEYWHHIDPMDGKGQFCDRGDAYRPIIFYGDDKQAKAAEASKQALIKADWFDMVEADILPAKTFYPAEDKYQQYYLKHPIKYNFYRHACGRDQILADIWDEDEEAARKA